MFCPKCQGDSLHDYECGLNLCGCSDFNSLTMCNVRHILQTINAFPVVDDLMGFVEQCRKHPTEWQANLVDEHSKYRLFFSDAINKPKPIDTERRDGIYSVFKTLLAIPQVNQMFQTTKHLRFLMHLIAHQVVRTKLQSVDQVGTCALDQYFKNSCHLNVYNFMNRNGVVIWLAIKPIQRGEH